MSTLSTRPFAIKRIASIFPGGGALSHVDVALPESLCTSFRVMRQHSSAKTLILVAARDFGRGYYNA